MFYYWKDVALWLLQSPLLINSKSSNTTPFFTSTVPSHTGVRSQSGLDSANWILQLALDALQPLDAPHGPAEPHSVFPWEDHMLEFPMCECEPANPSAGCTTVSETVLFGSSYSRSHPACTVCTVNALISFQDSVKGKLTGDQLEGLVIFRCSKLSIFKLFNFKLQNKHIAWFPRVSHFNIPVTIDLLTIHQPVSIDSQNSSSVLVLGQFVKALNTATQAF